MSQNFLNNSSAYKILFENSFSIMLIIDPNTGMILDANNSALEFYQYSKKEMLELNISQINTLSSQDIKKQMSEALSKLKNQFRFHHCLKNGEIRQVKVYAGPIDFGDKKVLYSIIYDISDEKLPLELIKESESTIRAMINATQSLVFLFDTDGQIINLNAPGARLFEKTPSEMIGENFRIFFRENAFSKIKLMVDEVVRKHTPIRYQADRNKKFYDVNLHPVFNKKNQVDRICAFVNDITDLKKTEKVFAAIETAGGICHDMNQPLQVIIGNLELLKMNIEPDNPNMKFVDLIMSQAEKLGMITKKLTYITHYETKQYVQGTIFDIDKSSGIK